MSEKHITPDRCCHRIRWNDIELSHVEALVQLAKAEDLDASGLKSPATSLKGDPSSALLSPGQTETFNLVPRQEIVACGIELIPLILKAYGAEFSYEAKCEDGDLLKAGQTMASVHGPVQVLFSVERPLLNFLQKLSGVSTLTRQYVNALGKSRTRILDTRKTTPGYRVLEKFAVACGGGWNHRIGLFDRVMLKDNHLAAFGDDPRTATIETVRESRRRFPELLVEMEVDSLEQIEHALAAGVDIVLLDNFALPQLKEALSMIDGKAVSEASGGITIENLSELGAIGLDFISTGATVHQSTWVDIGLDS